MGCVEKLLVMADLTFRSLGVAMGPSLRLVVMSTVLLLAFGACTDDSQISTTSTTAPTASSAESPTTSTTNSLPVATSTSSTTTSAPAPTATIPVVPAGDHASFTAEDVSNRDCRTAIVGDSPGSDLSLMVGPHDWIGPLILLNLSDAPQLPERLLTPLDGEVAILKYVTQIQGTDTVWLAVAPEHRERASLIYIVRGPNRTQDGRLPLDAGYPVVRLKPCEPLITQYNGGLLVSGVGCITLEVYVRDAFVPPLTRTIPFGLESCR